MALPPPKTRHVPTVLFLFLSCACFVSQLFFSVCHRPPAFFVCGIFSKVMVLKIFSTHTSSRATHYYYDYYFLHNLQSQHQGLVEGYTVLFLILCVCGWVHACMCACVRARPLQLGPSCASQPFGGAVFHSSSSSSVPSLPTSSVSYREFKGIRVGTFGHINNPILL